MKRTTPYVTCVILFLTKRVFYGVSENQLRNFVPSNRKMSYATGKCFIFFLKKTKRLKMDSSVTSVDNEKVRDGWKHRSFWLSTLIRDGLFVENTQGSIFSMGLVLSLFVKQNIRNTNQRSNHFSTTCMFT